MVKEYRQRPPEKSISARHHGVSTNNRSQFLGQKQENLNIDALREACV